CGRNWKGCWRERMSDSDWNGLLAEAAGEVLETMFFAGVDGPPLDGAAAAQPRLTARLRFEGTPGGTLTVGVSEPAARCLAANFLPSEDDAPVPESQLGGVVSELTNMICGSMLSRVKTESHFRLAS